MNQPIAFVLLLSLCIGATPSATGTAAAQKCLDEGKKLEALANKENEKSKQQFEQALQNYLCAAKGGNAEGAMSAGVLSTSGMAPKLAKDSLRMLYGQAVDGGDLAGYSALAESYCGEGGFSSCKERFSDAIKLLFTGNSACSCSLFSFDLGEVFLGGPGGAPDSALAFACFKQANGKGAKKRMEKILKSSPRLDTTMTCELPR